MKLCRLVYMSERNMSAALDVTQLIDVSRRNNSRLGVTGFLMFDGEYFAQALEGTRSAVTHTYNRIAGDLRHLNLHLISCLDVQERLFPGWAMGLLDGIPPEARERFLGHFTIERVNPNSITIERLLFFLQALAVETAAVERLKRARH
jgi:hypothetical protein